MSDIIVTSLSEFQDQLNQLGQGKTGMLYRGQPDSAWPVTCAAARRLTQDSSNPVLLSLIDSLLVGYLEFLIAKARMRQLFPNQVTCPRVR